MGFLKVEESISPSVRNAVKSSENKEEKRCLQTLRAESRLRSILNNNTVHFSLPPQVVPSLLFVRMNIVCVYMYLHVHVI